MCLLNVLERPVRLQNQLTSNQKERSSHHFLNLLVSLQDQNSLLRKKKKKMKKALIKQRKRQIKIKNKETDRTLKLSAKRLKGLLRTNMMFRKLKSLSLQIQLKEIRIQQEVKERSLINQKKRRTIRKKIMKVLLRSPVKTQSVLNKKITLLKYNNHSRTPKRQQLVRKSYQPHSINNNQFISISQIWLKSQLKTNNSNHGQTK